MNLGEIFEQTNKKELGFLKDESMVILCFVLFYLHICSSLSYCALLDSPMIHLSLFLSVCSVIG